MSNSPPTLPKPRITSIDAYRGFVMLLMLAEVLRLPAVANQFNTSEVWKTIRFHTTHVDWTGCSLHDLIQPSFSFLVGVALVFSLANRRERGQDLRGATFHAVWRALLLVGLGIFLRSMAKSQTHFTFEDTLTQIGLGYLPLYGLALLPQRWWYLALTAILLVTWAAFAGFPAPSADFNYPAVGVPADWPHHASGFAAHWNKNSNLAWAADRWFLNLFPREKPFEFNGGGYATLSFVPTLATMILGLIAGQLLRTSANAWRTVGQFVALGSGLLLAGWGLGQLGVCPVVKRIWTPSWVLFSGGCCFLFLAWFHAMTDAIRAPQWSFPLRVIGANSILIYCIADTPGVSTWIMNQFKIHFGATLFQRAGKEYEPLLAGACVLLVYWLLLLWMYLKRVFVRI